MKTTILLLLAISLLPLPKASVNSTPPAQVADTLLTGKSISDLTEEDFKLLLNTPVGELAQICDLELLYPPNLDEVPEDLTESEKANWERNAIGSLMAFERGYSAQLPIDGMRFRYNNKNPDMPPVCLEIVADDESVAGIPMMSSVEEIMEQWGETELQFYGTGPYGYSGALYQYIEYKNRNGLDYHFECWDYIDRYAPWYELDMSEWPWEEFPQEVRVAIISLEGSKTFYYY
jgi:hypothetical protein